MRIIYKLTVLSSVFGVAAARKNGNIKRYAGKAIKPAHVERDQPLRSSSWGGSKIATRSGGSFNDGVMKGGEEAEKMWHESGSDCSNIWTFGVEVDAYIAYKYVDDGNWKVQAYNRGVRAGADQVVAKYEKQCLDDSPDECSDLGEAAAQEIAFEFCPFSASASFAPESQPDYKQSCREAAYGFCEGALGEQVNDNGCDISTVELSILQKKCRRQVDMMTGGNSYDDDDKDDQLIVEDDDHKWDDGVWGGGDDEIAGIVTDSPTYYPTRHPTKKPAWGGGDDEIAGIVTNAPTDYPTRRPTPKPSSRPTNKPHWGGSSWQDDWQDDAWGGGDDETAGIVTDAPTEYPTRRPTPKPSSKPTHRPTQRPSRKPTSNPTHRPSQKPTRNPTQRPSQKPTRNPTPNPTPYPTEFPTPYPVIEIKTEEPTSWGGWSDDGHTIQTDEPTSEPTKWGGSHSSDFQAGFEKGEKEAEILWRESGSNCGNIFSFQDQVDSDVQKNCPSNSSFCRGVQAGANKVVLKYEKRCLEDTADECSDLGEAAAQEIAFDFCPFSASASFAPESQPDYKQSCRDAAYGICEGAVGDQVNDNGCDISTVDLLKLQQKCKHQVDMMTGGSSSVYDDDNNGDDQWHGSGDDEIAGIVSDSPTSHPTYFPTEHHAYDEWGGWKEPVPEPYWKGGSKHKRGGKIKGHHNDWH